MFCATPGQCHVALYGPHVFARRSAGPLEVLTAFWFRSASAAAAESPPTLNYGKASVVDIRDKGGLTNEELP